MKEDSAPSPNRFAKQVGDFHAALNASWHQIAEIVCEYAFLIRPMIRLDRIQRPRTHSAQVLRFKGTVSVISFGRMNLQERSSAQFECGKCGQHQYAGRDPQPITTLVSASPLCCI
jgi:hypothetical protein